MSRNLSTFNSKVAAYGALTAGLAVIWLMLTLTAGVLSDKLGLTDEQWTVNYRFQLEKLDGASSAETLFVGDSSLGALMDTPTWQSLHGRPSIQLALSGNYGVAGSYNMIRRAYAKLQPKNVVIVHSVDMMTRSVADLGYLQTLPEGAPADDISFMARWQTPLRFYLSDDSLLNALRGLTQNGPGRRLDYIETEWARLPDDVGAPGDIDPRGEPGFHPDQFVPDKMTFLKKIAAFCREKGANCVFAFGPVYNEVCRKSKAYLARVQDAIAATGLTVATETPICVSRHDLADTIDHVRQDRKKHYTAVFYDRLSRHLEDSAAASQRASYQKNGHATNR